MAENEARTDSVRKVSLAQSYIKDKYSDTIGLATSILGQVLLGTLKGSKRKKEVIKLCLKDMKNEFSDRVAEDPLNEIEFMRNVCDCHHPNFVRFIDAVEDNKLFCICIEYVIGGDMCTYIQNIGTGIENNRAKKYFIQLTKGVYFMHKKGFCHLDISLENVLFDKKHDIVKLCDFGLSKKFPCGDISQDFPAATIRPGKKGYMAPEIYSYQKFNGEKADVFSLGVIIFILLTGFPPFNTPNASDKCFQYMYYGKLEWLLKQWKLNDIISNECRDLLSKIFCHPKKRINIVEMLQHPYLNQNINDIDNEIIKYSNIQNNNKLIGKKKRKSITKIIKQPKNNTKKVRRPKSKSIAHINLQNLSICESSTLLSEFAGAHTITQKQSNVNYVINVDDKNKHKNKNKNKKRSKSLCYSYDSYDLSNIQKYHINNKWMTEHENNNNNNNNNNNINNINVTQIKNDKKSKQSMRRQSINKTPIRTPIHSIQNERTNSSNSTSHSSDDHKSNNESNNESNNDANLRQHLNETQLITQKYCNNGNFTPITNENEYDNDRKEGDYETYPDPYQQQQRIDNNNIQSNNNQERRFSDSQNSQDAGSIHSNNSDKININNKNQKDKNNNNNKPTNVLNISNTYTKNNVNNNRPSIDE